MNRALAVGVGALVLIGCGGGSSGSSRSGSTTAPPPSGGATARFEVVIENLSNETFLPTDFGAMAWTTHSTAEQPFTLGASAADVPGLEALAELGDPSAFISQLSAAFNQRGQLAVIASGQTTRFEFSADSFRDARLSLAGMLAESNDAFAAGTLDLFDASGNPIDTRQLVLTLYDAGTEINEVPGAGPSQRPRQTNPNRGNPEGVMSLLGNAPRAFPPAAQLVQIDVRQNGAELVFTLTNTAASHGAQTAISPAFFATHTTGWQAFTPGQLVPANGLESLAEDGNTGPLVAFAASSAAVASHGAVGTGPVQPGGQLEIRVTPDPAFPQLTILSMLRETNDAFVGFGPAGIALVDSSGAPRSASDLQAEARRTLVLWDAGSEANELPGAGPNQPARQAGPNTGPADSNLTVRRYDDSTNEFAVPGAGVLDISVVNGPTSEDLTLTFTNTSSGLTVGPLLLVFHDPFFRLFDGAQVSSPGLVQLAESGDPGLWASELTENSTRTTLTLNAPVGGGSGPLAPGQSYQVVLTPDNNIHLSVAGRISPSNDTYLCTDFGGAKLTATFGGVHSSFDIERELEGPMRAWDAGSEANEVGAIGPNQGGVNTGGGDGDGTVRVFNDSVWSYPATDRLIRVTVRRLP